MLHSCALFPTRLQALVTAMRVSHGDLLVSMNKCDTSHRDETLFNAADATGEYDLDLQVSTQNIRAVTPNTC